ncbi:MAG: hypothetical protein HY039_01770 [Nitrospirae bacterium]|nr:hypothetical protein [Nitrospirota bacterium]
MKAKAIRLPDRLLEAVKFAEKREILDEATALRKLLRLGSERYVAALYGRGEITLREAGRVLDLSVREILDLFLDMGVPGNVTAAQTTRALDRFKALRGD